MSNSGSESEFSDEEQGAQTFSIQPYQLEPRVNTDERDINAESLSGDEGRILNNFLGASLCFIYLS